ncbi:MAG TPA: formate dehydrogenase accessory sulfurtransferase FdhD [Opitutaceae bacterium]|nr:formate dehydrogenase accessory sulfurtransferase FdhD [Opitutaceae bacterium]
MSPAAFPDSSLSLVPSLHWSAARGLAAGAEQVVIEAPLALEIAYRRGSHEVRQVLAVTMRTPGADEELALGFLFAEGLIEKGADATAQLALAENARGEKIPTRQVRLAFPPPEDLRRLSRGLLTSSACGLCGRPGLGGLPLRSVGPVEAGGELRAEDLVQLPEKLRRQQPAFFASGGCHGAALATPAGELLLVREDVGRHNAVDKLIGAALRQPTATAGKILVLSGRASFELLQKAAMAGIVLVLSVGAPSSAAVQLAHAAGITLVGFAREGRFNLYSHAARLRVADRVPPSALFPDENHASVSFA